MIAPLSAGAVKRVVIALLALAAMLLYGIVGTMIWTDEEDDDVEHSAAPPPETTEGPTRRA